MGNTQNQPLTEDQIKERNIVIAEMKKNMSSIKRYNASTTNDKAILIDNKVFCHPIGLLNNKKRLPFYLINFSTIEGGDLVFNNESSLLPFGVKINSESSEVIDENKISTISKALLSPDSQVTILKDMVMDDLALDLLNMIKLSFFKNKNKINNLIVIFMNISLKGNATCDFNELQKLKNKFQEKVKFSEKQYDKLKKIHVNDKTTSVASINTCVSERKKSSQGNSYSSILSSMSSGIVICIIIIIYLLNKK